MNNQFNLEIKTACSENFNQFKPTPNGGFCDSCEKEVIDFTKMNAEEISTYFINRTSKNTCGRFNDYQLKTYPRKPNQVKKISFLSAIGLACLSLFSFNTIQAQEIENQTGDSENESSKIKDSTYSKSIVVKGNILDENRLPLPGVTVILEKSTIITQTDFDGNFEFPEKLKKGDVLIFSFLGYEPKKIIIDNKNATSNIELEIDMSSLSCILMGKVAVKKVYKSKKRI